jgi:hypothetical protein
MSTTLQDDHDWCHRQQSVVRTRAWLLPRDKLGTRQHGTWECLKMNLHASHSATNRQYLLVVSQANFSRDLPARPSFYAVHQSYNLYYTLNATRSDASSCHVRYRYSAVWPTAPIVSSSHPPMGIYFLILTYDYLACTSCIQDHLCSTF